ncbi:MAG: zinc metallopeptidase [Clostridia bacterium]|nr:zinc metallopeptidase [Clostridia bacterium]
MYFYSYLQYLIFAAPVLIFALIAQGMVNSAYKKYSSVPNSRHITGAMAAQMILDRYGITDVRIEPCSGKLTDHFSPKEKVIRLSQGVYSGTSVAAVGIACHEAGHAAQHAEGYLPNKIRTALVPITNFGSKFGLIIAFIGYFMAYFSYNSNYGYYIIIFGLALYGLVALFQFVTLPVEFNASKRALKVMDESGLLSGDEYIGAKKVLRAAALTYVAALATAIVNLLYYAIRLLGNNKRK